MQRPTCPKLLQLFPRRGFTLIEIMIVIVIITALMAFLIPSLSRIQTKVSFARVVTDISALEKSIADFNATFGMDPPSRITLYEDPVGWQTSTNNSVAVNREIARSRAIIRQLWPSFNFNLQRDLDNDGNTGEIFTLTGAECLVFFLGGMFQRDTSTTPTKFAAFGFSQNPADPFQLPSSQSANETRVGPFHEFVPGRLIDVDKNPNTNLPDGMPEYGDTLANPTAPYIYVSSNDGQGYDAGDLIVFSPTGPLSSNNMVDVYRQGDVDLRANNPNNLALSPVWKPRSFQIISPGLDRLYGAGGGYDQELGVLVPYDDNVNPWSRKHDEKRHAVESDNITNFSNGPLHD